MKKIVIGDIVSRAWDLAVKHWPIFVLFTFVNSILSSCIYSFDKEVMQAAIDSGDPNAMMMAYGQAISFNPIWGPICTLLSFYLSYVLINMYVNTYRTGKPYNTIGEIFKIDLRQFAIYFVVNIVYVIAIFVGSLLLVIPGIFLAVRLMYAPILAATQGASFGEALGRSWELTKGNFWNLFLLGLTAIGIAILGFCACCVGYYFAAVIIEFMLVVSFFILNADDTAATPTTDYVEVQ